MAGCDVEVIYRHRLYLPDLPEDCPQPRFFSCDDGYGGWFLVCSVARGTLPAGTGSTFAEAWSRYIAAWRRPKQEP